MGWEEAAAHQKRRLEEEERARIARWEAQELRRASPPHGSSLFLGSSSRAAPSPSPQTSLTFLENYQGVHTLELRTHMSGVS